jgi:hypothetical protein
VVFETFGNGGLHVRGGNRVHDLDRFQDNDVMADFGFELAAGANFSLAAQIIGDGDLPSGADPYDGHGDLPVGWSILII